MAEPQFTTEELQTEEWRDIPGFPGYQVSSLGRVVSYWRRGGLPVIRPNCPRFLKGGLHQGYRHVTLCRGRERWKTAVHRIVALVFLGERPPDCNTNHKDANKLNNRPENLEYVTPAENIRHAASLGLMPSGARNGRHTKPETTIRGEAHYKTKFTLEDVEDIRRRYAEGGVTFKQLAAERNVGLTTIHAIVRRQNWK